jgi:hypothetical protein
MEKHLQLVGAFHIAHGALLFFVGMAAFLFILGGGLASGDRQALFVTSITALVAGTLFMMFSLPSIIGGIGMIKRKSWSRILLIIMGILALPGFPFGTALGIYTLWVLLKDDAQQHFS